MKAKIIYMTLALLFVTELAMSQSQESGTTSVAILGGVNFQNLNGMDSGGDKLENDLLAGFHIGLNLQIPIAPEFYFQPSLLFSTKGAKNTNGSITSTYKVSYLELPLNLVYKSKLGDGYVMLGFGPYVGYAVGGKATYVSGSGQLNDDIIFTKEIDSNDPVLGTYLRPFDLGGNLFFGYEMASGIFVQLNTQLGMLNIYPDDKRVSNDKTVVKNTGFGLSLGFSF